MNNTVEEYTQEDPDVLNETYLKSVEFVTHEELIEKIKDLYFNDPSSFFDLLKQSSEGFHGAEFFQSFIFADENEIERQQEDMHINATNFLLKHVVPAFKHEYNYEVF